VDRPWQVAYSQDSGATWDDNHFYDVGGSGITPDVEPAQAKVRGVDADHHPVTRYSSPVGVG
jgi:hypothetical protein